jgi:VWFA-related protein
MSISPFFSAQELQEELQHEVTVTLKLIQVFVTDKKGNPVKDLTSEDFQVFVKGKPVVITDFEPHFSGFRKAEKIDRKVDAVKPKLQNKYIRKLLFIFDYLENDLAGISRSKYAFSHYIDNQFLAEDEAAVLSYSTAEGFIVHEYFTSDRERLKQTVNNLKRIPGFRNLSMYDALGQIIYREYFIKDMKDLAHALRLIPGTKNIVFFSHGMVFPNREIKSSYEDMCNDMAHAGASIFAIDTAGLRGARNHIWMKSAMLMLANKTGGQYFSSVEYYETFSDSIQNLTNNYYVLGFTISESLDGKFNKLKVKVNRKGCNVHTQGGYYNPKPFPEYNEIERRLHLIDLAINEEQDLQKLQKFPVKAFSYEKNETQNVMLLSELDIIGLKEVFQGKTEVVVLIADGENNIIESSLGRVNLKALNKSRVFLFSALTVSPGEYICRVVLRNRDTGDGAVGSVGLRIPKPQESATRFYPPLLLYPSSDCQLVSLLPKGTEEVLLRDIYPFITKDQAILFDDLDTECRRIRACISLAAEPDGIDHIELSFSLRCHASNQEFPLPHEVLSRSRNGRIINLLSEMELPEMKPGSYSVQIVCSDPISGEVHRNTVNLRMK